MTMAKVVAFVLWSVAFTGICTGVSLKTAKTSTILCGNWTLYKDDKCLKIVDGAGTQTQEDAEVICKTYADEFNVDSIPKLLAIKSTEEQRFVQRFLFVENELVDHVWLGLKKNRNSQLFEWNDGSELSFSNWANQTTSDNEHECVQMESGDGAVESGLWFRVSCKRKNVVVCERRPVWTIGTLQNAFLNFRVEQERKQVQSEENHQKDIKALKQEIATLKNNPVPLGFIYVQLPRQDTPTTLWPSMQWTELTSNYSGLFFRAAGGNAAEFGQIQEANSPRLKNVQYQQDGTYQIPITIPSDGGWSEYIYTGSFNDKFRFSLRYQLSTGEVRPRNQAVKIWQRIK